MIVLRAVRVEDTGAETELGEVRLTEVGAVFAHSSTPEGQGVIGHLCKHLSQTLDDAADVVFRAASREGYLCKINLSRPRQKRSR